MGPRVPLSENCQRSQIYSYTGKLASKVWLNEEVDSSTAVHVCVLVVDACVPCYPVPTGKGSESDAELLR